MSFLSVAEGTYASALSVSCLSIYSFIVPKREGGGPSFSSFRSMLFALEWPCDGCLSLSVGTRRVNHIAEVVNADLAVTHGTLRLSRGPNVAARPQG